MFCKVLYSILQYNVVFCRLFQSVKTILDHFPTLNLNTGNNQNEDVLNAVH